MWYKLTERLKRKEKPGSPIDAECLNCGTTFSGNFCPNCGQAVQEYDKPFGFIFYNFLGDFFAFDSRFFKTLFVLIARPGFLTKEYFAGRRVRYAPPFRLFVFVSFLLFFLLQLVTNRGLSTVLDSDLQNTKAALDTGAVIATDSVFAEAYHHASEEEKEVLDSALIWKEEMLADSSEFTQAGNVIKTGLLGSPNLRMALSEHADELEAELENETDPVKKAELRENIRLLRSPETAMAKILKYISYAFFLLLPLFALILKLIYIRQKHNYMRHLVFSIHIHSYIFLAITFIVGLYLLFNGKPGALIAAITLFIPVYIILAIKKFYGQSLGKVLLKFVALSFIYNMVFFTVILLASLDAINVL